MTRHHFGPADNYGVSVVAFDGNDRQVSDVTWSSDGSRIVTVGNNSARVWDAESLDLLAVVPVRNARRAAFNSDESVLGVADNRGFSLWRTEGFVEGYRIGTSENPKIAFSPRSSLLVYADSLGAKIYDLALARPRHLPSSLRTVEALVFDDTRRFITIGGGGGVEVIDIMDGSRLWRQTTHVGMVTDLAYSPNHQLLAVGSTDTTVGILDAATGRLTTSLEGHTGAISSVSFSHDGKLLASMDTTGTVILWDCADWAPLHGLDVGRSPHWAARLAFHPGRPVLAAVGVVPGHNQSAVLLWKLDANRIRATRSQADSVTYASAKIVLVGESGAGKTGLGYRLAHGVFKEHPSTHGQQFWLMNELAVTRPDGAECEAVLWDLAGQPDYRLIHALFLEDADLALVVFDPTRDEDPLRGVDYWLQHLRATSTTAPCEIILVAARSDRGAARLTEDDIRQFCADRGIRAYVATSALADVGLDDLLDLMRDAVNWEARPTSVTTAAFKRIKDAVLALKDTLDFRRVIVSIAELRSIAEKHDPELQYSDAKVLGAVGHLAKHGYVSVLHGSTGQQRVLMRPELLNNLAASIVLEARRNPRGLGSLEEHRLMADEYAFPELVGLAEDEREILLDSAVATFLAHNVCFRETDPLTNRVYLVFPELINLRRPMIKNSRTLVEGAAYTITGAVENVYASLVVMLGYTEVFTRTNQWRNQAEYTFGQDLICAFQLEGEREGELDLVLSYGETVGDSVRMLFQGLFESFLHRQDVTTTRFEPVVCSNQHQLNRAVVRELLADGQMDSFCAKCGKQMNLRGGPLLLAAEQDADLDLQRHAATQRSRFEEVLFRLTTTLEAVPPSCFISYAWGDVKHERWVERELATDLAKAGIAVILDRWENARIGASVPRFVERIATADLVIVVGSPLYREKYENREHMGGFVAAAEGDLIGNRMIGTEERKETVLPILAEGTPALSLPALLQGRVHADFTAPERYFLTVFDLILAIHGRSAREPAMAGLRERLLDL
ncbi:TIR domain-containing protein [Actinoplanes sp. NPDC049681]|uniref:WD40 domain-containing protein n=1 Tax=Actinoplanes sp. NPDC049681 TaxID=3363905 RepID=UPI003799C6BA